MDEEMTSDTRLALKGSAAALQYNDKPIAITKSFDNRLIVCKAYGASKNRIETRALHSLNLLFFN